MQKSRLSESQIVAILKEGEAGRPKYGGLGVSDLKKLKELEGENSFLRFKAATVALACFSFQLKYVHD